jgi:hypothetical protein
MNAAADQFESHRLIWGNVKDAVQFLRPSDLAGFQSPGESARAAEALALNQECFAAAHMFLGSLTILNIRACPIPPDDPSAFVSERLRPYQKPTVHSVMSPNTSFDLAWLS